jgi:DNA-binding NtrC family response regulator
MATSILVIEDHGGTADLLATTLREAGRDFEVTVASTGELGLRRIVDRHIDCVLLDYRLPDADGINLLARIRRRYRDLPVIFITAQGSEEVAVEAMKLGATDYVTKHGDYLENLPRVVREALGAQQIARLSGQHAGSTGADERGAARVSPDLRGRYRGNGIIGESPAIEQALVLAERAAHSRIPVLLEGETGTGKELFARVIHDRGLRARGPFLAQNCAALTESLLESELFGHARGAFTGADCDYKGLFEAAAGGTLFLDEIFETTPAIQGKLLRVLQSGEIRPVGSTVTRRVDVRVIAATNCDLEEEARAGHFRLDLYYRLRVFPIRLPPLRERPEDIEPLAMHFLRTLGAREGKSIPGFEADTLGRLRLYAWPGNVRELENEVHRLVLFAEPRQLIPPVLLTPRVASVAPVASLRPQPLKDILRDVEVATIRNRLRECGYSRSATARSLGIARETLWAKLRQLRIPVPRRLRGAVG